jgi:hypothetical protein
MTTITPRIPAAPLANNTRRVATIGAQDAVSGGAGGDRWGGTWGGTWGFGWHAFAEGSPAVPASPAIDVTPRIGSAPTANNTKRVTLA